ncbi:MAG: Mov34/MPN/PAD-1 family protein [Phycisphaerales bacterium]|nr:Mov34/MPN/PAD-1 family protein [Phycisphaerales bacterium]
MDVNAASFEEGDIRDISAIQAHAWPLRQLRPLPRQRHDGFQVVLQKQALDAIHAHGKSITDIEIGGFLIGNVFHDQHGPFLHITACIEARHATHHAAQVTFTSATWDWAHEVLQNNYPDQRIVGWYHTHPGFGVFLSGMDLFIQDNFFNLPWQVAMVYDPLGHDEGIFVWHNGVSERAEHLVHTGEFTDPDQTTVRDGVSAGAADKATVATSSEPVADDDRIKMTVPDENCSQSSDSTDRKCNWLKKVIRAIDRFLNG